MENDTRTNSTFKDWLLHLILNQSNSLIPSTLTSNIIPCIGTTCLSHRQLAHTLKYPTRDQFILLRSTLTFHHHQHDPPHMARTGVSELNIRGTRTWLVILMFHHFRSTRRALPINPFLLRLFITESSVASQFSDCTMNRTKVLPCVLTILKNWRRTEVFVW